MFQSTNQIMKEGQYGFQSEKNKELYESMWILISHGIYIEGMIL